MPIVLQQGAAGLDINRPFTLSAADVDDGAAGTVVMLLGSDSSLDRLDDPRLLQFFQWQRQPFAMRPCCADNVETVGIRAVDRRTPLGADDAVHGNAQQTAQLDEHPFGKTADGMQLHQVGRGMDDFLQAPAVFGDGTNLLVGAQCRDHRREQANLSQFALGAVIVDVVTGKYLKLHRVARLAGTQDDPHLGHAELLADVAHHPQASVLGFHDNIKHDHRKAAICLENVARFGRRIGMPHLDTLLLITKTLEHKSRGRMDLGVVIDNQDAPRLARQA